MLKGEKKVKTFLVAVLKLLLWVTYEADVRKAYGTEGF